jgi:endonuclease/exonuclease/phosphatase (EEP) superfamily protein YafD
MPSRPVRNARRRAQFVHLLERLANESRPLIVAGDFNSASGTTYTAALENLGLTDAHRASGHSRGATWPARGPLAWLPGIRIDHVFLSPELTALGAIVGEAAGSDHRPVVVEVAVQTAGTH